MTSDIPEPYLKVPFEDGVEPLIISGFEYSAEDTAAHGVRKHGAIDFLVPRGTKIIAPADGYYIATYGEVLTTVGGRPRTLSYQKALKLNPLGTNINPPSGNGAWPVYYGSYCIQGWHEKGRYTQYAHVDWVNPEIPYYPPVEEVDDSGQKTGNLIHSPMLRALVSEYRRPGVAAFLRAGTVIGEVGITGCGWGEPCYTHARFGADGRPDFRGTGYHHYAEPHLHFVTFARDLRSRAARLIDPFGIYGQATDGYPGHRRDWPKQTSATRHAPLWLNEE